VSQPNVSDFIRPGSFGVRSVRCAASRLLLAAVVGAAGLAVPAVAQPASSSAADDAQKETQGELRDFIHYVRIDRADLAAGMWRKLKARGLSDADFVALVESTGVQPFEDAVSRGLGIPALQDTAAEMSRSYEQGKRARARDPQEIAKNIAALTGTMRGRLMAQERLAAAGEYAMPQLLEAFLNRADAARRAEAQRVIISMGRQAVAPLCAALVKMPPAQQEQVADLLGLIPWKTSLPFLSDVAGTSSSDAVRTACNRAIERIGNTAGSTADLYMQLAEAYYAERTEVVSFPGEDFQLLWEYAPGAGLTMTAIRSQVFHEAWSMALCERAIQLQTASGTANPDSIALWVAANFSREIDTPAGYVNPVYPVAGASSPGQTVRRSAEYYAVAAGSDVTQRVLARALDTKDTPLARRALAAVERTAGVNALVGEGQARLPLVEALSYPNRRVQYEAALAIAAAQPQALFPASDRVVPTLASSIRGASQQFAAVIGDDPEQYQLARAVLSGQGYTVMPLGRSLADLAAPIAEAPAVDVVVLVGHNAERAVALIDDVRGTPKTAATPVLAVATPDGYRELGRRYDGNPLVAVRPLGVTPEALGSTLSALVETGSGGAIGTDEGRSYAARSLAALRDLAVSNSQVLKVDDAARPLSTALGETSGSMKLDIAEVLSRVNASGAQQAVMDAALAASGPERVALLGRVSQSAKRFGNLLEPRHTTRLLELARAGSDDEATAAAALLGALNSSGSDAASLILGQTR
jgi:HEAT repeat protein